MSKLRRLARKVRARIPIPRRRRIHAYGIGPAKTGTTSLYGIFDANFRAAHEPDRVELIKMFQRDEAGQVSRDELAAFLRKRDRKLQLEMDSSAMNRRYAALTAELFPASKFIMTVRDPYTRTDSLINHLMNNPLEGPAIERANLIFRADIYQHAPQEAALAEKGLHTLDGYLADYAHATLEAIDSLPDDRLLVIRTDRLRDSLGDIAEFLEVPESLLDPGRSHKFKAKKKHGVLLDLDTEFVDQKVNLYCGELLARYFPEIGSIADVTARLGSDL
jgi:hypothetical protein